MQNKTIVIVGAGPGLGLGIARRFGRDGFKVGLVCRNKDRGSGLVKALAKEGIEAVSAVGDVSNETSLLRALSEVEQRLGHIDVLEYSPVNIPADMAGFAGLEVTAMSSGRVQAEFAVMALGAVSCVNHVLPGMLARKSGTILITTGISAYTVLPMVGAWGMAGSAARNYALALHAALKDRGIFVGTVCIGVKVAEGDALGDPSMLAENHYALYRDRNRAEVVVMAPAASA